MDGFRRSEMRGGEGAILSGGFFFQELFESLYKDTLGISSPTIFPPAVTRLFFPILFYLMKPAGRTRFDNHGMTHLLDNIEVQVADRMALFQTKRTCYRLMGGRSPAIPRV